MNYSYNLFSNAPVNINTGKKGGGGGNTVLPARVIDVILDDTHPEWNKLGKSEAIGAIKYRLLTKDIEEEDSTALPVAFPLVNDFKKLPLKNEIVLLMTAPGNELDGTNLNAKTYYNTVVNLWNHPNHGGFPNDTDSELDLGNDIDELTDVNPLQPFPGDIIMDGRQGQSIRLGGFPSPKNILTDRTNNGKPFTILSNGQKDANDSFNPIIEDINDDASSIYLVSDHQVPLEQVRDKTDSYGFNQRPPKADEYKGSQVLVNGGRLYFNAKDEGIFLNANEYLELQSNLVNIDAVEELSLDAALIHLGEKVANAPQSFKEPILLGHQTAALLNTLIGIIQSMARSMKAATTSDGKKVPSINKRGAAANKALRRLKKDVSPFGTSPLKSKKVFTE